MRFRAKKVVGLAGGVLLGFPSISLASTGMPWERVIVRLVDSLTGPVTQSALVASIVFFGLALIFGDPGPMWRRLFMLIFGLSIAAGAASLAATLFPITAGATL